MSPVRIMKGNNRERKDFMKTIGKIAALAMTVGLAFALTACGGSASSSAASSASASASASSASAASSESASAASASAAASSVSAAAADLYTNEYFGIEFELPEGWTFTDGQTSASAASSDGVGGTTVAMSAVSADEKSTVVVAVEQNGPNAGKTAAELLEVETAKLTDAATQGNTSYTSESATITFEPAKKEMPASITTITQNGSAVCTGMAVDEKDGNFLEIIVTAPTEDEVSAILKHFQVPLA